MSNSWHKFHKSDDRHDLVRFLSSLGICHTRWQATKCVFSIFTSLVLLTVPVGEHLNHITHQSRSTPLIEVQDLLKRELWGRNIRILLASKLLIIFCGLPVKKTVAREQKHDQRTDNRG